VPWEPGRRHRARHLEASAISAFAPVLVVLPFTLLALLLIWLLVRLVWDVPYWAFALGYCLGAALLFVRPIQVLVLTPLFGARAPTIRERQVIDPLWRQIAQANHVRADRYILRVLPADELNAFACGGHLVVVTTFAIDELPRRELAGVLAHELSHHLGMHTVALTIRHWLSLPVAALAVIGYSLQNVARAAADSFGANSAVLAPVGRVLSLLLFAASVPFTAALLLADALGNVVGHGSELQADRRAVRMGYGRNLSGALRRVIALGGGERPIGWRARLAASHPPARTRMALIDAMLRHPAS
jgi:Zn-dependent protease with chaperone function